MIRKLATVAIATAIIAIAATAGAQSHTSKTFSGAKVNKGTVTHSMMNGQHVLTLSNDFQVPDTPDPHWQVVDSKGRVFLLQRLNIKNGVLGLTGDKLNRSITVPAYISDVAKVQIYCSWAEVVLGETTFDTTIATATTSR